MTVGHLSQNPGYQQDDRFTKIGLDGASLPFEATTWYCVKDLQTGYLWFTHPIEKLFTMASPFGGVSYYYPGASREELDDTGGTAGDDNDIAGIVVKLNAAGYCGRSNWQIPSQAQGLTVKDSTQTSTTEEFVWINTAYFEQYRYTEWNPGFWVTDPVDAGSDATHLARDIILGDWLYQRPDFYTSGYVHRYFRMDALLISTGN